MKTKKYTTNQISPDSYQFYKINQNVEIIDSYTFFSTGPKGKIELRILITIDLSESNIGIYNLAFGVWDPVLKDLDDRIETKNNDMDQILATVGETAINFVLKNPLAYLYAQGSTSIRTRKYQMGILKYFPEIPLNLGIYGIINNNSGTMTLENFQVGINYHAFLLYSK